MKAPESPSNLALTKDQFDVLAELLRSRGIAYDAARLVLLEGLTPAEAAVDLGVKPQYIYAPLARYRAAYEKVCSAFGTRK